MMRNAAIFLVAVTLPAFGDFSYQETSRITGGMMAGMVNAAVGLPAQTREAVMNQVAVKGNRMLRNDTHRASIIDLDKETITEINFDKKQYSVMTFTEMNQKMEASSPGRNSAQKAPGNYKVSTKETGRTRQIGGFTTREQIVTVEMGDLWIAPQAEGYGEVADFRKRMSEKLSWAPDGLGARPGMMGNVAELTKTSMGLDGMPVLQKVRIGNPARTQAGGQAPLAQGALIEMTTEYSGFSNAALDDAKFEVPAGFQQVEPELGRR
jgi:hypothetical protein